MSPMSPVSSVTLGKDNFTIRAATKKPRDKFQIF